MNSLDFLPRDCAVRKEMFTELVSGSAASFFGNVDNLITNQRQERSIKQPIRYMNLVDKITGFENLQPNWDSYNADSVSPVAIATAAIVLNHLERARFSLDQIAINVFPMRDGGVQFEFDGEGLSAELEINSSGEALLQFFDDKGNVLERIDTFELSEIPNLLEEAQYA